MWKDLCVVDLVAYRWTSFRWLILFFRYCECECIDWLNKGISEKDKKESSSKKRKQKLNILWKGDMNNVIQVATNDTEDTRNYTFVTSCWKQGNNILL